MGRILFHKYEIIRLIGTGGAGKVFLALDRHLNRLVAVKESRENMSLAEMELLRELEHAGLPRVFDYFKEQGSCWLVMEYIEGMTLRQYLDRHERVNEGLAVRWMLELCQILNYLHDRHPAVIYRDLKPENIIVRQDGTLKLVDLGGAVRCACGSETADMRAGTAGYCPGEQWKGTRADVSWDIYALGAVFHEMLTGACPAKPPYGRRPLSEYDKSLTRSLEKIIDYCTGEKQSGRYQSVTQVEEALLACEKQGFFSKLWRRLRLLMVAAGFMLTAAYLFLPLLWGIPQNQLPFPYLKKPLFFLAITLLFYFIFFRLPRKNRFSCRQEKNIFLTRKQFSGLITLLLFLGSGVLSSFIFRMTMPVVYAEDEPEQLWVEMRDDAGRKLLLKTDAVYRTSSSVRFELPADRLPDEEISLQMVAVGEKGDVYSSRIFRIKAEEDLN